METREWQHPKLGDIGITQNDLAQFADNYKRNVRGVDLAVDVSHNPDAGAVAWFKDVKAEPGKLMAKVAWTKKGADLVKSGKYRYFSPEFMFNYKDSETGQTHRNVLLGGGVTNRPFLKGMDPVAFSESGMGEVWMSDDEDTGTSTYDPDDDGDDDSTTDPSRNPDWPTDVMAGITPWPDDNHQQAHLTKFGATKEACDAAFNHRLLESRKISLSMPTLTTTSTRLMASISRRLYPCSTIQRTNRQVDTPMNSGLASVAR